MAGARGAYNPRPMTTGLQALGLAPGSRVHGVFRPGGSKSLAQRALLFAAVARGTTVIEHLPAGEDVRAARALVTALGVQVEAHGPLGVRLVGRPPDGAEPLAPEDVLELGESGTLARLATALVALASAPGTHATLAARGSLLFRRSRPLFAALARAGVKLERQNLPGTWPVELVSAAPAAELTLDEPLSSQEVSALLAALAAHADERVLIVRGRIPSEPYVALTLGLLALFGATHAQIQDSGVRRYTVRGPLVAPRAPLVLEPDASSAAVALAAACLSGGTLEVPGLGPDSLQGDVRIVAHLSAFGCAAGADARGLRAHGFPSRGAELDLAGEPDLAPVLCALAAGAALRHGAPSVLRGLATLPGKESDRLGGLAAGLRALGLAVEAGADQLVIAPGSTGAPDATRELDLVLDPRGDHRMAFAFALFGLLAPGVRVGDPGCVAKSWSTFWSDLERLGAVLTRG